MKTGIVAGSFDPITLGHTWLIKEACGLVDELYVAVGLNKNKKGTFTPEVRQELIKATLRDELTSEEFSKIRVVYMEDEFLVNFAKAHGIKYIFRGIRNSFDFEDEHRMQQVNQKISPDARTVFLIPPRDLTEVSSTVVRSFVGLKGWQLVASSYVHPAVLKALEGLPQA